MRRTWLLVSAAVCLVTLLPVLSFAEPELQSRPRMPSLVEAEAEATLSIPSHARPRFRARTHTAAKRRQSGSSSAAEPAEEHAKQNIVVADLPPPAASLGPTALPPGPPSGFLNPFEPLRARQVYPPMKLSETDNPNPPKSAIVEHTKPASTTAKPVDPDFKQWHDQFLTEDRPGSSEAAHDGRVAEVEDNEHEDAHSKTKGFSSLHDEALERSASGADTAELDADSDEITHEHDDENDSDLEAEAERDDVNQDAEDYDPEADSDSLDQNDSDAASENDIISATESEGVQDTDVNSSEADHHEDAVLKSEAITGKMEGPTTAQAITALEVAAASGSRSFAGIPMPFERDTIGHHWHRFRAPGAAAKNKPAARTTRPPSRPGNKPQASNRPGQAAGGGGGGGGGKSSGLTQNQEEQLLLLAAAKAAAEEQHKRHNRVVIMDIPPGVIGLAQAPNPPSPIPQNNAAFGPLRAKQIYPSYEQNAPQKSAEKPSSLLDVQDTAAVKPTKALSKDWRNAIPSDAPSNAAASEASVDASEASEAVAPEEYSEASEASEASEDAEYASEATEENAAEDTVASTMAAVQSSAEDADAETMEMSDEQVLKELNVDGSFSPSMTAVTPLRSGPKKGSPKSKSVAAKPVATSTPRGKSGRSRAAGPARKRAAKRTAQQNRKRAGAKSKTKAKGKHGHKHRFQNGQSLQGAARVQPGGAGPTGQRKGHPVIFDFPPGYFGFGGNGGNFKLVNPHSHPANPLNLNPFQANAPKMGFVTDPNPGGFQPPGPAVGLNQFGGLRAKQIYPSYTAAHAKIDSALAASDCMNCEFRE